MKLSIATLIKAAALGGLVLAGAAAAEPTAPEIMRVVDRTYRQAFLTAALKVQLSTCRYTVKDDVITCREKPRVTVLEVAEKKFGEANLDSRSIALVLQPVADKGVGMLSHEYFEVGRDNDVQLYLPALGKIRRVVSGAGGNEDGGSFFGTEYFTDDTQIRKVDEFTYTLLREDAYEERPVWVVESVPTAERARKTQYGKSEIWIDQERHVIVREDIFNRAGKFYRQRLNREFVERDGVWLARLQTMNNLNTRRISAIQNLASTYHRDVPDELVSERSLTDFAFRERTLETLRAYYE